MQTLSGHRVAEHEHGLDRYRFTVPGAMVVIERLATNEGQR